MSNEQAKAIKADFEYLLDLVYKAQVKNENGSKSALDELSESVQMVCNRNLRILGK